MYDANLHYWINRDKTLHNRREYYANMCPEMKEAFLEQNRERNQRWYRKKHPNAKPYKSNPQTKTKKPKPAPKPPKIPEKVFRVRNELKTVYLRWD